MQQDQGHGVVLHDQGEDHQQPITYRSGSESRKVSTYECWGSVQQVLRPHPFTNVGSFWNSLLFLMVAKYYILGLTLSTPSLVYFFLSRILRNFLVAAANCIHSSFSLFLRENLRTRIGETVGDGVIALFLACFIQS